MHPHILDCALHFHLRRPPMEVFEIAALLAAAVVYIAATLGGGERS